VDTIVANGHTENQFIHIDNHQFAVNISKQNLLKNLNKISSLIDEEDRGFFTQDTNDSISIKCNMFPIGSNEDPRMVLPTDPKHFPDAIFYFEFTYDENNKVITLLRSGYNMGSILHSIEGELDENDMVDIFRQNIIAHLNNNTKITFTNQNAAFDFDQMLRRDLFSHSGLDRWIDIDSLPVYTIVSIDDRLFIERLINAGFIVEMISFPSEYQWYRYPDKTIAFRYKSNSEEIEAAKKVILDRYNEEEQRIDEVYFINETERVEEKKEHWRQLNKNKMEVDMEIASKGVYLINIFINIWKNSDQYFCQLNGPFFYIDVEILQSTLGKKIHI
jgi:hypothetical protein